MLGWQLWLAGLAVAGGDRAADAEITVYGDALAPWEGTRWWVASESVDLDAPVQLGAGGYSVLAPAWQSEAVLRCEVSRPKRQGGWVRCVVEDAALRVVTYNQWQRPEDRRHVDDVLRKLRDELKAVSIRLRIHGQGTVTVGPEQEGRANLVAVLLGTAIDAFHLEMPEGGWQDGAKWYTTHEPLLALNLREGTFGFERAVHHANVFQGANVVQTLAAANRRVVTAIRDRNGQPLPGQSDRNPTWSPEELTMHRFLPEGLAEEDEAIELTEPGKLVLNAVADYDVALGAIRERVWTVHGEGAASVYRAGRLRRLGDDEEVTLGATLQVGPPRSVRPGYEPWRSVAERKP